MSTIHEAYSKKLISPSVLDAQLATLDRIQLFPLPPDRQRDEFLKLANMLLGFKPAARGAIIAFASTAPGEGTSFVSYNAARELAHMLSRRVAWIDANFHSPQPRLNALGETTFAEMLRDPRHTTVSAAGSPLTLIAGGMDLDGCASDLVSDRFPKLLEFFSQKYDFTILDAPPILDSVETEMLAAQADGLIVVIEKGRLKREVIKAGLDQLAAKRVNILGTVFNRRTYDLPKAIYDRL